MTGLPFFSRMSDSALHSACTAVGIILLLHAGAAPAGEMLQRGFYLHDTEGIAISNARSGLVCDAGAGDLAVCETAHKVLITGEQTCDYPPDKRYPCTRFGYEFDYAGVTPGATLDCTVSRTDPNGRRTSDVYQHKLGSASGHVEKDTFRTFAPVDERLIFAEVHECRYRGQLLNTTEFLVYYEPGTGEAAASGSSAADADPYFAEVPDACASPYLTEATAAGLLNAPGARRHAASEHIPTFWSQCLYGASGGGSRGSVGFVFKFMLADMYDVDTVDRQQLIFNVTFGQGGADLKEIREDLGDMAFVFEDGNRTTLLVIPGINGPDNGAGQATEFIANYYIEHPEIPHEVRLARLLEEARRHLREWGIGS